MRRILSVLLLLLVLVPPAWGIQGVPIVEETITVSSAAVGFTANLCRVGVPSGGKDLPALIMVLNNPVYYTLQSASATPDSNDYIAYHGQAIEVEYPSLFRAIRVSGDAKIKVTCFQ